jgi:ubiquinone/menaquinone biosynthesis C-methylase UbiE
MKLNWAERWVVNSPTQVLKQRLELRWMKRTQSLAEGAKVLEVGCGLGVGAHLINESFRPSLLHALDLDVRMVLKAKAYLSRRHEERVSLSVGDVFQLPFKDNAMDAVFGFGILHHVQNWRGAVREIARVLKTGGHYFIEELYPTLYQNFITKHILLHPKEDRFFSHDLRDALDKAGIPLNKVREVKKAGIIGVAIKNNVNGKQ